MENKHNFEIFADYFQLYVMDENSDDDLGEIWTDQALDLKLAIASKSIAVGTFRNVDVPFQLELVKSEPMVSTDEWDHISIGFFTVESGKCVVMGCTDYKPEASRVDIPPGKYAVLSLAKGLDSIETEWDDADDFYKLIIWPSLSTTYDSIKKYENS